MCGFRRLIRATPAQVVQRPAGPHRHVRVPPAYLAKLAHASPTVRVPRTEGAREPSYTTPDQTSKFAEMFCRTILQSMDDDVDHGEASAPGTVGLRHVDLSAEQLKTLAHPIRARLLTALRAAGPATATALALRLGTNSGTTSYHLRKLADVDLVQDAPEHGDGRDRWWRAAQDAHSYRADDFDDDPDAVAAADWLYGHYLRWYTRRAEDWAEQRHEWPAEWQRASTLSDYAVHLTAEELAELNVELDALLARWRREGDPGRPGAEKVIVLLHDFPVHDRPS